MNREKLEGAKNLFVIALGLDIAVTALVVISDFWGVGVLKDIGAGRITADQATISTMEYWDSFAKLMLLTTLGVGLGLVKWLNTCYTYAKETIGASGFKNEGWTTGGWIIPIFNMFKPYQVINEIYKAGNPTYALPDGWKKESGSGLLLTWWVFWVVTHFIGLIVGKQVFKSAIRDDMTLQESIGAIEFHAWFCVVFLIISGLWFVVAGGLTRRLVDRLSTNGQSASVRFEAVSTRAATPQQARAAIQTSTESHMPLASSSIAFDENEAYKRIAEEIETGGTDKGLWLRAMVQTTGQDERVQKVVYSQLRLEQLKAESAERTFAEAASNLAKEVPEFHELEAERYVPVGKQDFLGVIIRELANGLAAVETTRQQRVYKDVSAAKSAIQEFRQDGRWTLRGLTVAIERSFL